jgi:hypothetical protein
MPERDHDPSASTAQFRAFADDGSSGGDSVQPWTMRARGNHVAILAVAVVAVAIILAIIAFMFIG